MVNNGRRKFLRKGSVSLVGVVVASKLFPTKVAFANNEVSLCESAIGEFDYVYQSWSNAGLGPADQYISHCGISHTSDIDQIQLLSVQQFRRGETFSLDGLVLSKIEAALMADIGKLYC